MANIRFIKSPNDNRVRSHPGVVMINDVISNSSSASNEVVCISTPKINNIIHITTPKRQVRNMSTSDIFITNNNNNCHSSNITSSSVENDQIFTNSETTDNMSPTNDNFDISRGQTIDKYSSNFPDEETNSQERIISNLISASLSDIDQNSNVPFNSGKSDNRFKQISEFKGQYNTGDNIRLMSIDADDYSEKPICTDDISENMTYIHNIQCEANIDQAVWTEESPAEMNESKRSILKSYSTFDTVSDGDLSDVLDEEVDQLPDINLPGSAVMFSVCQHVQQQPHEQQKFPTHEGQKQQSSTRQYEHNQEPYLVHNSLGYMRSENNRHIHRSISDAGVIENREEPSFFRSINDSKFYGFNQGESRDIDNMVISIGETDTSSKITEPRKLTHPTKIAWDSAISDPKSDNISQKKHDKKISLGSERPRMTKPGDGHFKMSRSLSGDSALADRLRIRRCALADPENMIMRQDVREKIERDVEKRRSSMVRKISQFFNVHLGLNKEEDLI